MTVQFVSALQYLAHSAGWKSPKFDEKGVCRFEFEDGLRLVCSSPDGRICVLCADLGVVPDEGNLQGEETLRRIGRTAAALMPHGRSVAAARDGRLELFRRIDLSAVTEDEFVREVESFLNEESRWRDCLEENRPATPFTPFSFFSSGSMPDIRI